MDADGKWQLTATPNLDYALDYWESAEGAGATDGFTKVDGSDGQTTLTVTVDKDMTYRAVFTRAVPKLTGWHLLVRSQIMPGGAQDYGVFSDGIDGEWYKGASCYTISDESVYSAAVAGSPAQLTVGWNPTGALAADTYSHTNPTEKKFVSFQLYSGDAAVGEPIVDSPDINFFATNASGITKYDYGVWHFRLYFIMPDSPTLTYKLTYKDINHDVISTETLTVTTPLSSEISELKAEYDKFDNLKWRYLINYTINNAAQALTKTSDAEERQQILDTARSNIEGYIAETNNDYIEVKFKGVYALVPNGISQVEAMCAALEQAYPREKGYWRLSCAANGFGYWVNEITGVITEGTDAHETRPRSGIVIEPQRGGMTYSVNGFFANFGISGWKCSDGEEFSWGPPATAYSYVSTQPQRLPPEFISDAKVSDALAKCAALTGSSSSEAIAEARAVYAAIPATFWNPLYAQFLFRTYEPYKTAYDNLVAAELALGNTGPLPTVTASAALAGALGAVTSSPGVGSVNGEWAVLAL
ncbi:MAG: hypothetical protein LBN43_09535, partial [Oscillospiraceae bacterium]|nr:hypothetical protein [Oscillospiraceae bacterium]